MTEADYMNAADLLDKFAESIDHELDMGDFGPLTSERMQARQTECYRLAMALRRTSHHGQSQVTP